LYGENKYSALRYGESGYSLTLNFNISSSLSHNKFISTIKSFSIIFTLIIIANFVELFIANFNILTNLSKTINLSIINNFIINSIFTKNLDISINKIFNVNILTTKFATFIITKYFNINYKLSKLLAFLATKTFTINSTLSKSIRATLHKFGKLIFYIYENIRRR